jgi:hypothetical protein
MTPRPRTIAHGVSAKGFVKLTQQFQSTPVLHEEIQLPRVFIGEDQVAQGRKGRVSAAGIAGPDMDGLKYVPLEGA